MSVTSGDEDELYRRRRPGLDPWDPAWIPHPRRTLFCPRQHRMATVMRFGRRSMADPDSVVHAFISDVQRDGALVGGPGYPVTRLACGRCGFRVELSQDRLAELYDGATRKAIRLA